MQDSGLREPGKCPTWMSYTHLFSWICNGFERVNDRFTGEILLGKYYWGNITGAKMVFLPLSLFILMAESVFFFTVGCRIVDPL